MSLSNINMYMTCIFVYQCLNGCVPDIFNDFYTCNRNIHGRETRQASDLHVPYGRLDIRQNSMKIHGANMWNSIPEHVKMSECVYLFKQRLRIFYYIETTSIRMGRRHDGCSKTTNWWEQSSRRHSVPTSMLKINKQWIFLCLHLRKYDCCWKSMHWWLYVTELSVMGHVAAWPLFGPLSRRPVTGSGLCSLIDGRPPVDAVSGCPAIGRAVETGR